MLLLYMGRGEEAEQVLGSLTRQEPRGAPGLRWLARAQKERGRPGVLQTTQALLTSRGAEGRDHFWAARLFEERGLFALARESFARAVKEEEDLYLGWLCLGDVEAELGHKEAARKAWTVARSLYGGGDALFRLGRDLLVQGRSQDALRLFEEALRSFEAPLYERQIRELASELPSITPTPMPPLTSVLRPGEKLRYRGKYWIFRFATLEMEDEERLLVGNRWAHRIGFSVKARLFFLNVKSHFESVIAEEGFVIRQTNVSEDSQAPRRAATYEMDPERKLCTVRHATQGLFGYDRLPLPPGAQDGISVIPLARAVARTKGSLWVLTAADGTWKGTQLRAVGTERIEWRDTRVPAVKVEMAGHYKGPGGLSGLITLWISDDDQAIPLKAKMKVALGSVDLELLPEAKPGAAAREDAAYGATTLRP